MKGLCKLALVALVVAACGGDVGITEPVTPTAPPVSGGILALGVDSTTGASIETNKDDYVPGEVVHLVGRGWAPGETVNLHMTEAPNTHADIDTNVVADAAGGFSLHFYDVQMHDLGVTFTLTATGQTSHGVAVATFTDGNVSALSSPVGVPSFTNGAYVKYTQSTSCGSGNSSSGAFSVNSTTAAVIVGLNNDHSLLLTVPATLAGYAFDSWTVGSPGIVVSGSLTNPSGLCIKVSANSDQPLVTVNYVASNSAPTLTNITDKSVNEGSALSFTATASDSDTPAQTLTFSLIGAPTGASIGS